MCNKNFVARGYLELIIALSVVYSQSLSVGM